MLKDSAADNRLSQPRWRSLRSWLAPRPFEWVSTPLYLCVFVLYVYYHRPDRGCDCDFSAANAALVAGMILCLLAIDRVEYWRYGDSAPGRIAALLLAARIALIEAVIYLDNVHFSVFMYLLLPFIGVQDFGERAGYVLSGMAWIAYIITHPLWYAAEIEVNAMILFSLGLVFVNTMASAVLREQESRARAEKLLRELEVSHRQLAAYADQVAELATTQERNRLAREIHDSLGHYLTVINVQLEKALAYRNKKPDEADQATLDAKRLASEALQ